MTDPIQPDPDVALVRECIQFAEEEYSYRDGAAAQAALDRIEERLSRLERELDEARAALVDRS